jgi:peptidoglycan hydrolase-like protein with peptidoglycan-binding domain
MHRSNAGPKMMRSQRVQEFLILNGFAVSIDGDFGPATEKRVRDFQTARGLPATGVVGIRSCGAGERLPEQGLYRLVDVVDATIPSPRRCRGRPRSSCRPRGSRRRYARSRR